MTSTEDLESAVASLRAHGVPAERITVEAAAGTVWVELPRVAEYAECEGHQSLRGDLMGQAEYCDGSCRGPHAGRRRVALGRPTGPEEWWIASLHVGGSPAWISPFRTDPGVGAIAQTIAEELAYAEAEAAKEAAHEAAEEAWLAARETAAEDAYVAEETETALARRMAAVDEATAQAIYQEWHLATFGDASWAANLPHS